MMQGISNLVGSLLFRHIGIPEGSSLPEQLLYLSRYASTLPPYSLAVEVGFNAGFSSYALLSGNPTLSVVSFDINEWDCVLPAKTAIDEAFPSRHHLELGDSRHTLASYPFPQRIALAYIDGGHIEDIPYSDIKALAPLTDTLIVDDTNIPIVRRAFDRAVSEGLILPRYRYSGGHREWSEASGVSQTQAARSRFRALTAFV